MQNKSTGVARDNLANLAKFDPEEDSISRFSQKSHSHPSEFIFDQGDSGREISSSQQGNDIPPANQAPIFVTAFTPLGDPIVVEADNPDHAAWIRSMNPEATAPTIVRCCDCAHAKIRSGIAKCGAGVVSRLPTGCWWATDRHFCASFKEGRESPACSQLD